MAIATTSIMKVIKRYLQELEKEHIPVMKAFLFGSYAHGNPREESDIDIVVVSSAFSGDRFKDRRRIVPLRRKIDSRIEPIPFRPKDFKKGGVLADTIKKTGIVVK